VTLAKVELFKLLYSRGQAEKEFRVEVEAIGHVRHKNLVRLLGYCIEGTHRYCFLLHCVSVFTKYFYQQSKSVTTKVRYSSTSY